SIATTYGELAEARMWQRFVPRTRCSLAARPPATDGQAHLGCAAHLRRNGGVVGRDRGILNRRAAQLPTLTRISVALVGVAPTVVFWKVFVPMLMCWMPIVSPAFSLTTVAPSNICPPAALFSVEPRVLARATPVRNSW